MSFVPEDKKKAAIMVGGLVLLAGYSVYTNLLSDGGSPSPAPRPPAATQGNEAEIRNAPAAPSAQPRPAASRNAKNEEFHPVFRKRNARPDEQQIDPATIDPTLHLELLAKVQEAKLEGGQRNLFQFGAAAPVQTAELPKKPEPIIPVKNYDYPRPLPPKVDPPPPPPPVFQPPTLKYYGLATKRIDNKTTGFFLDGEEIILATEGMTLKTRWRIVRIGADSVMLEDSQSKKQGTVAISEEAGGTL